jgi:predicted RNA-binding Zn-ribbon protein involved in translation (DUF1610 family)
MLITSTRVREHMKTTKKVKPKKPRETMPCPNCGQVAEYNSYSGDSSSMSYLCRDNLGATGCGHRFSMKPTKPERAYLKAQNKEMWRHSSAIHRTWHAFSRRFGKKEGRGWKLKGYAFMEAVEKWAKKYPEVQIVAVDDNHHSSSALVLVPHFDKREKDYWGTTLVYIPQCSGEDAIDFFMYPSHLEGFMDGFKAMRLFALKAGLRRGIP